MDGGLKRVAAVADPWRGALGPVLLGVVNATPDSFSDGGALPTASAAVSRALELLDEGADWIDVGGESTRPGAAPVAADEEMRRVIPVIEGIHRARPAAVISVDTSKPDVAEAALEAGARVVNDVGGLGDPRMVEIVRRHGALAIAMHMRGTPGTMQADTSWGDLVAEVSAWLDARAEAAVRAGIPRGDVAIDPGLGFGKSSADNPKLVAALPRFAALGWPVAVGASRKRFVGDLTGVTRASDRVFGSVGAALAAVEGGARVIRVHDVRATREALAVYLACRRGG